MNKKPIYVTQPFLPPLEEFIPSLRAIWDSKVLTNGGPFHQQLEKELCQYLGVKHLSLFTNATIALMTALQALEVEGEVITTPYSFVATAHSLLWNKLKPVFVDIEPGTMNLDPARIEAAITPQTTAILPVHCYGYPCDVTAIRKIAETHKLKVLYDAAHAFGVNFQGQSLLNQGDLSVLSFHATKVFNTFEGGAIISHDLATKQKIDRLKNFGYVDEVSVESAGLNGKMSEIHAAFGLLQLKHIEQAIEKRRTVDQRYRQQLTHIEGIEVLGGIEKQDASFSYFPIRVQPNYSLSRDALYKKLKDNNYHPRRYFFPLITEFPPYKNLASAKALDLPIASRAANEVLCLPIYPDLALDDVDAIIGLIAEQ